VGKNRRREKNIEQKDIERLRQKLELQRDETRQFLRRVEREAQSLDGDSVQDSADRSVISVSKEFLFERSSQRRTVLRLIEAALKRIADGSFGVCVGCGDDIQSRRLEALPWTQFCLRCQGELEEEIGSNLSARILTSANGPWKRAG
jgi:DnaK suppressor protein